MSTQEVASSVRDVYARGNPLEVIEGLTALMADQVDIRHVPTVPMDSVMGRDVWKGHELEVLALLQEAFPDLHLEALEVATPGEGSGEEIRVASALTGTYVDGSRLEHRVKTVFTARSGTIVRSESHSDPDSDSGQLIMRALGRLPA